MLELVQAVRDCLDVKDIPGNSVSERRPADAEVLR